MIHRAGYHLRRLQAIFDECFLRKEASRYPSGEHLGLLEVLIEVDLAYLAVMIGDLLLVPAALPDEEPEYHYCDGHCDTEKEGKDKTLGLRVYVLQEFSKDQNPGRRVCFMCFFHLY
jgi:hypothetical protein